MVSGPIQVSHQRWGHGPYDRAGRGLYFMSLEERNGLLRFLRDRDTPHFKKIKKGSEISSNTAWVRYFQTTVTKQLSNSKS